MAAAGGSGGAGAGGSSLSAVGTQLRTLAAEIQAYLASPPRGDMYSPPIVDWHHPDEYSQTGMQGLSKFLHHVHKESAIVDALLESPCPPVDYSTNLVSLQGVWDAFVRAPRPLLSVWQAMDWKHSGPGPSSVKVDVVADGGDEWVKVNTIKESRLMVEFREQDSYINSDYDSDSDSDSSAGDRASTGPELSNSLLTQAKSLVDAASQHRRLPGRDPPRIRYVLTRLEEHPAGGHPDPRIPQTFEAMRALGIELEFAMGWSAPPPTPSPLPDAAPAGDIMLDLSVLIALCCDSTHYPLPKDEDELEARFRFLDLVSAPDAEANGNSEKATKATLAQHSGATRDLRDQLQCEMVRPLILELRDRLTAAGVTAPRFWCTREVHGRLPGLVEVIGGTAERRRAKTLFDPTLGDFWEGSRWQGDAGCLTDIRVRVIEDTEDAIEQQDPQTPFDAAVIHVCERMLAASNGGETPPPREPTPVPTKPVRPPKKSAGERPLKTTKTVKAKAKPKDKESRNPLRTGTTFPASSRLPSGHTLRTLLAGVTRRATVLTNNRGAVLKVMREAGVTDGLPHVRDDGTGGKGDGARRARIWVVNPSSLAEWRRIEVEEHNRRVAGGAQAS